MANSATYSLTLLRDEIYYTPLQRESGVPPAADLQSLLHDDFMNLYFAP